MSIIFLIVTRPGFEPRQAESESAVLPLYYRALKSANLNLIILFLKYKSFINVPLLFSEIAEAILLLMAPEYHIYKIMMAVKKIGIIAKTGFLCKFINFLY